MMYARVHPESLPQNRQLEIEFVFGTMRCTWVENSGSLRTFHAQLGKALDESDQAAAEAEKVNA